MVLPSEAPRAGVMHGGIPFPKSCEMIEMRRSDFGFKCSDVSLIAPRRKFFALHLPRRAESKVLYDERMVVLLLALLVDPIVGADLRLKYELVTLARMFGDGLAETLEGDEPNCGDGLPHVAAFVLTCIVIADEAQ